jgi:hypothetical protein
MDNAKLPLDYLLTSSQAGLEGFELGRLNQIANLRKELREIVDLWVQAEIEAELARWLLESRRAQESAAPGSPAPEISLPRPGAAIAAAFLPLVAASSAPQLPAQFAAVSPERPAAKAAFAPRNARARQRQRSPTSEEAQGSLNFLEKHVRSETEALGPPLHALHSWSAPSDAAEPTELAAFPARNRRNRMRAAGPVRAPFSQFAPRRRCVGPVC